jgi:hypothetical protein
MNAARVKNSEGIFVGKEDALHAFNVTRLPADTSPIL